MPGTNTSATVPKVISPADNKKIIKDISNNASDKDKDKGKDKGKDNAVSNNQSNEGLSKIITIKGGAGAGLGLEGKVLGITVGGGVFATFDAKYENGKVGVYESIEAEIAAGLENTKIGAGYSAERDVANKGSVYYNNPNPFYGIGEDKESQISTYIGGEFKGNPLIGTQGVKLENQKDITFTLIGGKIGVGVGLKGEINLNLSEAYRQFMKVFNK